MPCSWPGVLTARTTNWVLSREYLTVKLSGFSSRRSVCGAPGSMTLNPKSFETYSFQPSSPTRPEPLSPEDPERREQPVSRHELTAAKPMISFHLSHLSACLRSTFGREESEET